MRLYRHQDFVAHAELVHSPAYKEAKERLREERKRAKRERRKEEANLKKQKITHDNQDAKAAQKMIKIARKKSEKIKAEAYDYKRDGAIDYSCAFTALPNDVLEKIGEELAKDIEPLGIYGPDIAARDLASMKRAAKAFKPLYDRGWQKMKEVYEQKIICMYPTYDRYWGKFFLGEPDVMLRFINDPTNLSLKELRLIARDSYAPFAYYTIPKALLIQRLIDLYDLSPYMYGQFPCRDMSDTQFLKHVICAKKTNINTLFKEDVMRACNTPRVNVSLSPLDSVHKLRVALVSKGIFSLEALHWARKMDIAVRIIQEEVVRLRLERSEREKEGSEMNIDMPSLRARMAERLENAYTAL